MGLNPPSLFIGAGDFAILPPLTFCMEYAPYTSIPLVKKTSLPLSLHIYHPNNSNILTERCLSPVGDKASVSPQ